MIKIKFLKTIIQKFRKKKKKKKKSKDWVSDNDAYFQQGYSGCDRD